MGSSQGQDSPFPSRFYSTHMIAKVEIHQITLSETYPVRRAVLYPNGPEAKIHVPKDDEGTHFGAWINWNGDMANSSAAPKVSKKDLIVVISLFREPLPPKFTSPFPTYDPVKSLRFRKFACLESHQGEGFGSQVLEHVYEFARLDMELGTGSIVWCDARRSTEDWYMRRGMQTIGDGFFKGDIEYITMAIQI